MTPEKLAAEDQTSMENSLPTGKIKDTSPSLNENGGQINSEESQTVVQRGQRKIKKNQTENVKWSIFTEAETKIAASKAAKKAGLKLNEWIDRALREQATAELTKKSDPPAKAEDLVKDIVDQFAQKFEASQEAARKAQSELIEKQGQQIADLTKAIQSQPRGLKEILFGKKPE